MQITRAGEYAVLGLLALAGREAGQVVMLEELCRGEGIPKSFLAKIFQSLVRAGLVRSVRGVGGGFVLARTPGAISVLQIIEAVEGPITLQRCQAPEHEEGCVRSNGCPLCGLFGEAQHRVRELFSQTTLASLLATQTALASLGAQGVPILFKSEAPKPETLLAN